MISYCIPYNNRRADFRLEIKTTDQKVGMVLVPFFNCHAELISILHVISKTNKKT